MVLKGRQEEQGWCGDQLLLCKQRWVAILLGLPERTNPAQTAAWEAAAGAVVSLLVLICSPGEAGSPGAAVFATQMLCSSRSLLCCLMLPCLLRP